VERAHPPRTLGALVKERGLMNLAIFGNIVTAFLGGSA